MKYVGFVFLFCMLLSACSPLTFTPTPVNDGLEHILWVGDDQLQTGPLDLQTLLLLELAGDTQSIRMHRVISPRFTLASELDQEEFLQTVDLGTQDLVIIQAFGVQRNFSDDDFEKNARSWINFLKTQGKQVAVFYPWVTAVDFRIGSGKAESHHPPAGLAGGFDHHPGWAGLADSHKIEA